MPKKKQQETAQYGESRAGFREVSPHAIHSCQHSCKHSFHRRVMDEASIHVGPHTIHSCQHSFHRHVMDEASIHVGPHAIHSCQHHFTDVSWTRLRSMSAPMPFIHVNIISQTCHGRGFDPCRPPMPFTHVNIISQTCHGRGYTPRHSPNNTPQGAAGSARQINTPQGTAVARHLNRNVTHSRQRHVKDETMSKVCEGGSFMKQSLQTTCKR